ncbi:hypothetical protein [Hydrogenophaga sp. RAC07]|uniref:hypothetical protein n=1 Tax=Hydrogenophaga sp. RAC07 TaxID=1842537 RepID=UPI00156086CC|nr:hypothetical protein [Hydrogenophaga sp. RAC07]
MRLNKRGDQAVSREVWQIKASSHEDFASWLSDMAEETKKELSNVVGLPVTPAAESLVDALTMVVAKLQVEAEEQQLYAQACRSLQKKVRVGRPSSPSLVSRSPNRLLAIMQGRFPIPPKRRPGRPKGTFAGPAPDEVYGMVAAHQAESGSNIATSLEFLWPALSSRMGHSSPNQERAAGLKKLRNLYDEGRRRRPKD